MRVLDGRQVRGTGLGPFRRERGRRALRAGAAAAESRAGPRTSRHKGLLTPARRHKRLERDLPGAEGQIRSGTYAGARISQGIRRRMNRKIWTGPLRCTRGSPSKPPFGCREGKRTVEPEPVSEFLAMSENRGKKRPDPHEAIREIRNGSIRNRTPRAPKPSRTAPPRSRSRPSITPTEAVAAMGPHQRARRLARMHARDLAHTEMVRQAHASSERGHRPSHGGNLSRLRCLAILVQEIPEATALPLRIDFRTYKEGALRRISQSTSAVPDSGNIRQSDQDLVSLCMQLRIFGG